MNDPSTDTEIPGLIPNAPSLRPADIFTSAAIAGRRTALDIGIMSSDVAGVGNDACEAMWKKKMDYYGPHLPALEQQDIRSRPLTFTTFGRCHPEADQILDFDARNAAKKYGSLDHTLILRRCKMAIGVALWRRAAAMVRMCMPPLDSACLALVYGGDPASTADPAADAAGSADAARSLVGSGGLALLTA